MDCDPEGESYLFVTLNNLGSFAKLRKVAISFDMSVRPSVRPSAWKISAPIGRIFMKFYICGYFENMKMSLKCDKDKGYIA